MKGNIIMSMRVMSAGNPVQVGRAIGCLYRNQEDIELRAMGPDALWIAVRAVAVASKITGEHLGCTVETEGIETEDGDRVISILKVEPVSERLRRFVTSDAVINKVGKDDRITELRNNWLKQFRTDNCGAMLASSDGPKSTCIIIRTVHSLRRGGCPVIFVPYTRNVERGRNTIVNVRMRIILDE